jgi:hypothetical protein
MNCLCSLLIAFFFFFFFSLYLVDYDFQCNKKEFYYSKKKKVSEFWLELFLLVVHRQEYLRALVKLDDGLGSLCRCHQNLRLRGTVDYA